MKTEITREDFLNFNKHCLHKKRSKRRFLIPLVFIIIWILILNLGKPFNLPIILIEFIFSIIIWICIRFIIEKLGFLALKKMSNSNESILGPKTYVLEENGFREISENSEAFIKWNGIKNIEEVKDYYFIYVDNVAGYIIPKRDFLDKNEEDKFIEIMKEYMNQK